MKKVIKSWLFKDELEALQRLQESVYDNIDETSKNTSAIVETARLVERDHPTHDAVSDMIDTALIDSEFITQSDLEEAISDSEFVSEYDLQSKLDDYITEYDVEDRLGSMFDDYKRVVREELQEFITVTIHAAIHAIDDLESYKRIKRYADTDFCTSTDFELLNDQLSILEHKIDDVEINSDLSVSTIVEEHIDQSKEYINARLKGIDIESELRSLLLKLLNHDAI
jgi:hypothetical protein